VRAALAAARHQLQAGNSRDDAEEVVVAAAAPQPKMAPKATQSNNNSRPGESIISNHKRLQRARQAHTQHHKTTPEPVPAVAPRMEEEHREPRESDLEIVDAPPPRVANNSNNNTPGRSVNKFQHLARTVPPAQPELMQEPMEVDPPVRMPAEEEPPEARMSVANMRARYNSNPAPPPVTETHQQQQYPHHVTHEAAGPNHRRGADMNARYNNPGPSPGRQFGRSPQPMEQESETQHQQQPMPEIAANSNHRPGNHNMQQQQSHFGGRQSPAPFMNANRVSWGGRAQSPAPSNVSHDSSVMGRQSSSRGMAAVIAQPVGSPNLALVSPKGAEENEFSSSAPRTSQPPRQIPNNMYQPQINAKPGRRSLEYTGPSQGSNEPTDYEQQHRSTANGPPRPGNANNTMSQPIRDRPVVQRGHSSSTIPRDNEGRVYPTGTQRNWNGQQDARSVPMNNSAPRRAVSQPRTMMTQDISSSPRHGGVPSPQTSAGPPSPHVSPGVSESRPLAGGRATLEIPEAASVSRFKAQFEKPENVVLHPDPTITPKTAISQAPHYAQEQQETHGNNVQSAHSNRGRDSRRDSGGKAPTIMDYWKNRIDGPEDETSDVAEPVQQAPIRKWTPQRQRPPMAHDRNVHASHEPPPQERYAEPSAVEIPVEGNDRAVIEKPQKVNVANMAGRFQQQSMGPQSHPPSPNSSQTGNNSPSRNFSPMRQAPTSQSGSVQNRWRNVPPSGRSQVQEPPRSPSHHVPTGRPSWARPVDSANVDVKSNSPTTGQNDNKIHRVNSLPTTPTRRSASSGFHNINTPTEMHHSSDRAHPDLSVAVDSLSGENNNTAPNPPGVRSPSQAERLTQREQSGTIEKAATVDLLPPTNPASNARSNRKFASPPTLPAEARSKDAFMELQQKLMKRQHDIETTSVASTPMIQNLTATVARATGVVIDSDQGEQYSETYIAEEQPTAFGGEYTGQHPPQPRDANMTGNAKENLNPKEQDDFGFDDVAQNSDHHYDVAYAEEKKHADFEDPRSFPPVEKQTLSGSQKNTTSQGSTSLFEQTPRTPSGMVQQQPAENRGNNSSVKESAPIQHRGYEAPSPQMQDSPRTLVELAALSIHAVDYEQAAYGLQKSTSHSLDDEENSREASAIPKNLAVPPEFASAIDAGSQLAPRTERINKNHRNSGFTELESEPGAESDVVFGDPSTFGTAGNGSKSGRVTPTVADRAKAIAMWKGGLGQKAPKESYENSPNTDNQDADPSQNQGDQYWAEGDHGGVPMPDVIDPQDARNERVQPIQVEHYNPSETEPDPFSPSVTNRLQAATVKPKDKDSFDPFVESVPQVQEFDSGDGFPPSSAFVQSSDDGFGFVPGFDNADGFGVVSKNSVKETDFSVENKSQTKSADLPGFPEMGLASFSTAKMTDGFDADGFSTKNDFADNTAKPAETPPHQGVQPKKLVPLRPNKGDSSINGSRRRSGGSNLSRKENVSGNTKNDAFSNTVDFGSSEPVGNTKGSIDAFGFDDNGFPDSGKDQQFDSTVFPSDFAPNNKNRANDADDLYLPSSSDSYPKSTDSNGFPQPSSKGRSAGESQTNSVPRHTSYNSSDDNNERTNFDSFLGAYVDPPLTHEPIWSFETGVGTVQQNVPQEL